MHNSHFQKSCHEVSEQDVHVHSNGHQDDYCVELLNTIHSIFSKSILLALNPFEKKVDYVFQILVPLRLINLVS